MLNQYKESGAFVISITNTEQCLIAKMSDINFSCYMPETYGKNTGSVRGFAASSYLYSGILICYHFFQRMKKANIETQIMTTRQMI